MKTQEAPQSLLEAVQYFSDADACHSYMASLKWPDGKVICPQCGSANVGTIKSRRMYQCRSVDCRKQFSSKVGTIFEDSPIPLTKWFVAVWCITNAKNGISSYELGRAIRVSQKSAWFMLHRIRHAMKTGTFKKFSGEVEADETYIGGKAINMHRSRRAKAIAGTGGFGKAIVHGLLERSSSKGASRVKATVIPDTKLKTVQPILCESIEAGSHLYTDMAAAYQRFNSDAFIHEKIDHAVQYVRGQVSTNGLENFWSLLKRSIKGTYVSVDAPHLGRYVDEQVFRFNERKGTDADRFATVMPQIVGKRLTYKTLTQ